MSETNEIISNASSSEIGSSSSEITSSYSESDANHSTTDSNSGSSREASNSSTSSGSSNNEKGSGEPSVNIIPSMSNTSVLSGANQNLLTPIPSQLNVSKADPPIGKENEHFTKTVDRPATDDLDRLESSQKKVQLPSNRFSFERYSKTEICKMFGIEPKIIMNFIKKNVNPVKTCVDYYNLSPVEASSCRRKQVKCFEKLASNFDLLIASKVFQPSKTLNKQK